MLNKPAYYFWALLLTVLALSSSASANAANKNQALINSRLDIIGAKVHGQPPVAFEDLLALEPACALVLRYVKREQDHPELGVWYEQLKGSPLLDEPENQIAKGALSFHHYCWGEVVRNRYYRETDPRIRRELAEYVVSSPKWMIDNPQYLPGNWPYLPKLYISMGKGYLLLKDGGMAINAFLTALRLDPKQRIAYTNLSDALVDLGKKDEALSYIKEGLKYLPNVKSLQRRYQELGGKLPYPEPYPEAKAATAAEPAPSKEPEKANVSPSVKSVDTAPISEPETNPPIGTKDNPYCRFCTD